MYRRTIITVLIIATATLATGCDSGGGDVGPVILITNQWWEEGDPDHRFSLQSPDDGRSEGAFTGEEEVPREDFTESNDLVGFWNDGQIQFTVQRATGDVRYRGSFDDENATRLEFTSADGDLVIVRD